MSNRRLPVDSSAQTRTYPARFTSLEAVREFVGEQAELCGLDPEAVYQVQLAVDEAFSNIVEHAFGGECDEEVECTCQIAAEGLTVILVDCGRPFAPEAVPDPDRLSSLQKRQIGGLGVFFIRHLMDEVQYGFVHGPDGEPECNILRMFKRKGAAS